MIKTFSATMKYVKVVAVCAILFAFMPPPKSKSGIALKDSGFMFQVQSIAPDWVNVQLVNTTNNTISYFLQIPPAGQGEYFVIEGDYDVTIWPSNTSYYHDYEVGCDGFVLNNQASQYVFAEPISLNEGCNSMFIGGHF